MRRAKLKGTRIGSISTRSFSLFRSSKASVVVEQPEERVVESRWAVVGPPHLRTALSEDVSANTGGVYISIGILLELEKRRRSLAADLVEELQGEGTNLPGLLVCGLLKRRVVASDCASAGWVLDGFPTTAKEMEYLVRYDVAPERVLVMTDPSMSLRAKREAKELIQRFPDIVAEVSHSATWGLVQEQLLAGKERRSSGKLQGQAYTVIEEDLAVVPSPQPPLVHVPNVAVVPQSDAPQAPDQHKGEVQEHASSVPQALPEKAPDHPARSHQAPGRISLEASPSPDQGPLALPPRPPSPLEGINIEDIVAAGEQKLLSIVVAEDVEPVDADADTEAATECSEEVGREVVPVVQRSRSAGDHAHLRRRSFDGHIVPHQREYPPGHAPPPRSHSDKKVFERLASAHTESSLQRERQMSNRGAEHRSSRRLTLLNSPHT